MPVIIEPADWSVWLGETEGDPTTLLKPGAEDVLRFWPVDKKVGNVRNDGSHLIAPVVPAEMPLLEFPVHAQQKSRLAGGPSQM